LIFIRIPLLGTLFVPVGTLRPLYSRRLKSYATDPLPPTVPTVPSNDLLKNYVESYVK
jgi:hypothetical protein